MAKQNWFLLACLILLSACKKLENTIEIPIDPSENDLVVECYLEAGQPLQLILTETKGYFDVTNICPFVRHALVVITYNGIKDTLVEAPYSGNGCSSIMPYWNADSTRFYNYASTNICPSSWNTNFALEVWDTINDRYVSATTQAMPVVPITTFKTTFNADSIASVVLSCQDDLTTNNYYRMTLHKNTLSRLNKGAVFKYVAENPYFDQVLYDQAIFNQGEISHASDYEFYRTDSLIATIYHIDQAYYNYLITSRNAREANLNPFVEPSTILSNIQGGYGIFTFLSYDRDTLYIPW